MVGTVLVAKHAQPPEIRIIERSPKEEVILFTESKIEKIIEKKR